MFLEAFNQGLIMHEMGGFDVQKAEGFIFLATRLVFHLTYQQYALPSLICQ